MHASDLHAVLGRFVIARVLSSVQIHVGPTFLELMTACRDVGVCLDFLWFTSPYLLYIVGDVAVANCRAAIISRLPFVFEGLEITAVDRCRIADLSDASLETVETVAGIIGGCDCAQPSFASYTWPETNRQLLLLRVLAQTKRFRTDSRFREWLSETISLGFSLEGEVRDALDFPTKESVLPLAHFFLDRCIDSGEFAVKPWHSPLAGDPLAAAWVARFAKTHFDRIGEQCRGELLDIFSCHAAQCSVREALAMLMEADWNPARDAGSLLSLYQARRDQISDAAVCSVLLNGKGPEEVTADLENAIFESEPEDRIEMGRFAGEIAAALPAAFARQFFERLVDRAFFPGTAAIAQAFLFRAATDVLMGICGSAAQLINNSLTKLQFFMEALMPSVLRLSGAVDAGADLLVAWIDALRLELSEPLREALLDVIETTYWMLHLTSASPRIAAAVLEKVPGLLQMTVLIRLELNV
jgi:hypothetical protein